MKRIVACVLIVSSVLTASGAFCAERKPSAKKHVAPVVAQGSAKADEKDVDRYLAVVKPDEVLHAALVASFGQSPDVDFIMKEINMAKIKSAMKKALLNIYNAEEMKLLADFVSQPGAKNILNKSNLLMKSIGPDLQTELTRVVEKKMKQVNEQKEK
ncbi:hypothetical protein FY034_18170 (plasmid) [Trichlorobacter lovleyi]|uniref:hypothetical protein n=1 Tax=Trichlorobacter lovleyi TaxID=313985 RepID=UPI0022409C2E|nr:hypothetical protein [Trichlorobacter lovleyi]QOX80928.1 hypothetical protein FY034_18170 [Trichlorobacter lovleyi]